MAPSAKQIEQALLDGTNEVYSQDPDDTTVNKVRRHVEENLGLEEGFFSSDKWKKKSKTLIKERADKLMDGWVPDAQDESKASKSGTKRRSVEVASPEPKRQKRGPKPKKLAKGAELDEVATEEEEEEPKPRKQKAVQKKSKKLVKSDEEEDEAAEDKVAEPEDHEKAIDNDDDDVKDEGADDTEIKANPAKESEAPAEEDDVNGKEDEPAEKPDPVVNEEEEYSDVIDEPVKPKRKKKAKGDAPARAGRPAKAPAKSATTSDDPQEAEIKKLQSHLMKCGIRKMWHNELKQYGDDAKGKIRHLKKMLADAGMEGRFSEAKAREIKERRELLADVEAAAEMDRLWGTSGGGRASRSKSRTTKIVESDGSEDEGDDKEGGGADKNGDDDDDEEEEGTTYAARRRRAQAELAFLGDDSDSG